MVKKTRILIIEDNNDIRDSITEILELGNYEVLKGVNGKHGVELAINFLPDLILCDIMMPGIDGYCVFHLLSNNIDTSTIPFIFLTAKIDRKDMRKGMEMGADDYVTKPFDDAELLNAIECRLKKKQHQQQLYSQSLGKINSLFSSHTGLEELKQLTNERKIKHIRKKQVVYYKEDTVKGIYFVVSGKVKTMKIADDGRELLTGIYGPSEYFGVASMLAGEDYFETAEAMEDTALCLMPKEILEQLLQKYPDVSAEFIKILANNVLVKEEQLLQLAYHSVRKRMAELLVNLNTKGKQGEKIAIDVTRDTLASMAGMATETVSRILSDFKKEGLITKNEGKIVIIDNYKLENIKN
ncbi:CRP-like cAMP-binding protein/ActR/RegA family two-component response regulator [Pedobacter sp. CG_S7]|uniref:response regulator n=1 Tax=Pedobacter sp. CG_S7 TaxID=3143930 RepID=UPI00339286C1